MTQQSIDDILNEMLGDAGIYVVEPEPEEFTLTVTNQNGETLFEASVGSDVQIYEGKATFELLGEEFQFRGTER